MMIIHLKHPTLRSYHSRKGAPHSQRIPTVGNHKACHKIRIVHKHEFPTIVFQKSPGLHRVMYLLHLYMTKSVCKKTTFSFSALSYSAQLHCCLIFILKLLPGNVFFSYSVFRFPPL